MLLIGMFVSIPAQSTAQKSSANEGRRGRVVGGILGNLERVWSNLLRLGPRRLAALGLAGITVFAATGLSGYYLSRPAQAARVHIVMPDEGSFRRARQPPSASVILRTDSPSDNGVAASIRHLVSAAVPASRARSSFLRSS